VAGEEAMNLNKEWKIVNSKRYKSSFSAACASKLSLY
jgi:hypothetical protein